MAQLRMGFSALFVVAAAILAPAAADELVGARYVYDVSLTPRISRQRSRRAPHKGVEFFGTPRRDIGHRTRSGMPKTFAHYRDMLKSSAELRAELAELRKRIG